MTAWRNASEESKTLVEKRVRSPTRDFQRISEFKEVFLANEKVWQSQSAGCAQSIFGRDTKFKTLCEEKKSVQKLIFGQ